MLKTIIGDWGSELDDGDYACALAALGVLESSGTEQYLSTSDPAVLVRALEQEFASGERTVVWRKAKTLGSAHTIDTWRRTVHKDAAALAAAWRAYRNAIHHERQRPRLAIALNWRDRSDLFDFNDLCAWLNHDAVGLDALVLADWRKDDAGAAWHWPLRVGVPLGTEDDVLAALRTAQDQYHWVESLSRCYAVGGGRDSCDLLILTTAATAEILAQTRTRIRARFVVCLDDPPSSHSEISNSYRELRGRLQAAGLAVVGYLDNSRHLSDWFTAVVHDLSHDVPIHAAVSGALRVTLDRHPVTLGSPEGLDRCRILALAERQDRVAKLLARDRGDDEPAIDRKYGDPSIEPTFGGPSPESPTPASPPLPRSLRRRYADDFRKRMFTSESVDGEETANELSQREYDIERTRSPRWIQANTWRADAPQRLAQSLAPNRWNLFAVHVGPTERIRSDAPFPERYVDFSRGSVAVTVQLEVHGTALTPIEAPPAAFNMLFEGSERARLMQRLFQSLPAMPDTEDSAAPVGLASSEITLPQAGNSTPALFALRPQERVDQVEGRIAIIHSNRILQTARLSIMTGDSPDEGNGLDVVAEAPIHPRYDDLDERREYDVAIQVSDVGGKLHLTIQQDGEVTQVQLDDLGSPISSLRKALELAAVNWDYSKPVLEQVTFPENLYTLAASGSALEQHLRKKCGDRIDEWERIHLVPATNEFLPLEYVYDGPPPRTDANVCPNMLGALERESCDKAVETPAGIAACPNQHDKAFVCPMHFWGFRKLIERTGAIHPSSSSGQMQSAPVCVPSKQAYGKVRGMLFAASNRTFLYEDDPQARLDARAALVEALGKISGVVSDANDWDEWREKIKKNPNLLVLVVHSDKYRNVPSLEIGDKRFLGYQEISKDLSGAAGQPQLLILLGCSVASVNENFQPYPERFRDAGVSIVLAPVATIRGADAVPIAKRIAHVLSDRLARPEPTAFGELLPLLRRELLRQGHPGVMGIVGFGDGDWLLGGS